MAVKTAGDYVEAVDPKGYVNNREITNLEGHFLVKGSKNTKIINQEKVVVRPGFTILGAEASIKNKIDGSVDWKTNNNDYRNIRAYYSDGNDKAELEVLIGTTWERIKNGFSNAKFEFVPVWSSSELMDLLLMVNGDDKLRMWSGGIAEVAGVTGTTITKKGYLTNSTIAFSDNGANADTITDTNSDFLNKGFAVDDEIKVTGTTHNDGSYTIASVTATTITLIATDRLITEAVGSTVILKWATNGTWAESRFLVSTANRTVRIGGIDYEYTGGEGTGTLTGVSSRSPLDDGVVAGDRIIQSVMEYAPATLTDNENDIIEVLSNHVFIGSYKSRKVFISNNDDFTSFTYTTPVRKPGEGFVATFDSTPTAFVPDENDMYISAGDDDWYRLNMELNADQQGETVIVKKLKTAPGQAAVNPGAIARIKNNIAYVSQAKALDSLGAVENITNVQTLTLSDDIRDDFLAYDLTDVHTKFWRESIYIALPNEQLVLEYDMRYGYWQPPAELPVSRLAIINNQLCGHSANSNETYIIESGFNDNGVAINAVAAFGYENFGTRFMYKNFSESAHEMYMSRSTVVKKTINLDYKGSRGTKTFDIVANEEDETVFVPTQIGSIGDTPLGTSSFGGEEIDMLVKKREVNLTGKIDFFERQVIFQTNSLDGRFELLAYGENIKLSENVSAVIKR